MKIGIDIDNTIAPTFKTIIDYLNKKYSVNKKHKHSKQPSGYDLFHTDFKSAYSDWKEFVESKEHKKMTPITGSTNIIKKLSLKHQIYIITARNSKEKFQTILWIDKHYKNKFEEILFLDYQNDDNTRPLYTKGDLCKRFKIEVMVEDDFSQIKEISKKNPKMKLLLFDKNGKYTWNKKRPLPKNTTVVKNWTEVEKEIKKIIQN